MKQSLILALVITMTPLSYEATAQSKSQSFQEFRQGILNDFSHFRARILEHYADFLNGEWHQYESLKPQARDNSPKPTEVPKAEIPAPQPAKPQPVKPVTDKAKPSPTVTKPEQSQPVKDPSEPKHQPTDSKPESPVSKPDTPAFMGEEPTEGSDCFNFHAIPVVVPSVEFNIKQRLLTTGDYASQWERLRTQNIASQILPSLKKIADQSGLNDYLTYRLIYSYARHKLANAHETAHISLCHYLLANMGYDVRIAITTQDVPTLLLPTQQTIYGKAAMAIGDRKYYIFFPDGHENDNLSGLRLRTCQLPAEASQGNTFDMRLGELNIPFKPYHFDISHGNIHLEGELNENLMPILYRYPQIPIADYACSNLQPKLRNSLVTQIQNQVAGMDDETSVAALLDFMQNAFDYSIDEENHGFEKPYFLEETLYYPKNDCEDRAIFYTYFLWNALGKQTQLVSFPGHEAATVMLDNPINGTSYDFEGETYYISDPTFVGAPSGMVMPSFRNIAPVIDYTFK